MVGVGAYGCISHIIARYSVLLCLLFIRNRLKLLPAAQSAAENREQRTLFFSACCFVFGSAQPSALSAQRAQLWHLLGWLWHLLGWYLLANNKRNKEQAAGTHAEDVEMLAGDGRRPVEVEASRAQLPPRTPKRTADAKRVALTAARSSCRRRAARCAHWRC